MNITFLPLSELPIGEAAELRNRSFEGYFVPASMPLDRFIARTASEGLSLEHSLACYVEGEAAGIVINGFRDSDGVKTAWNGGTGIVPAFRGQGVGKALMRRNLQIYEEQGVKRAYLEAIDKNEQAIRLYESVGYEVIDQLLIWSNEKPLSMPDHAACPYQMRRGMAAEVGSLPFYTAGEVWQAGVPSLKEGESVIVFDGPEAAGYALFKRTFGPDGRTAGITLYRLEVAPGRTDGEAVMEAALREVWQPELSCRRGAFNIRASNAGLVDLLRRMEFGVSIGQVLMVRDFR